MCLVKKRTIEDRMVHVDYLMIGSRSSLSSANMKRDIESAIR
uniref:Uncharacterized protein n=1 Tax=Podoviridae sp. ctefc32 TaxID=2827742 RepID=A0A8S5T2Q1_9CAUD|nr:MAG TPA: hypothetical protein [Podoviridae sp. ctefc32]